VRFAQSYILGRLRHLTFFSLAECQTAVHEALRQMNERPMRRLGISRQASTIARGRASVEWSSERVHRRQDPPIRCPKQAWSRLGPSSSMLTKCHCRVCRYLSPDPLRSESLYRSAHVASLAMSCPVRLSRSEESIAPTSARVAGSRYCSATSAMIS
jgi:hypothetical protein